MKRFFFCLTGFLFFLFVSSIFAGSIEDIRNKLNKNQSNEAPVAKCSSGKRFRITQVRVTPMQRWQWGGSKKHTTRAYAAGVVMKVKKKQKGEKFYCPEILKVYAFDKKGNLFKLLERYMVHTTTYVENFRDFQVNKTYHLLFWTDFEVYKAAKTYIAVIGSPGEEVVAKHVGKGKIEDFDFPEKTYLNIK